ncbi:beta-N-acetylhexosaminidase [Paenibacillus sp. MBLB2552]|uniref:beta-N-acetylhexosaminidase n=1 Tax=Paenibacillus mellifer TaxID=2937794 RepID=A0A9X1XYA5_9BACL|nr:beta-N-acetylhexosaminidase [Paenibacillus mellifer]MCK8487584.1 beta-N-acetylhexosaminidase [Paenibacillus mellifer]
MDGINTQHRSRSIWMVACLLLIAVLLIGGCSPRRGAANPPTPSADEGNGTGETGANQGEAFPSSSEAPDTPETPTDPTAELLAQLSTEEKIGQLVLVGMEGTKPDDVTRSLIEEYRVGGFIFYKDNIQDTQQALELFNGLKAANAKQPVPLFLSVDEEGGRVSRMPGELTKLPTARKIGNTGSEELAGQMGGILGRELAGFGLNLDFAPVLDVNSNPDNPVIGDRAFGTKPEIVSRMGIAVMKGIREQGVIPVVKHFPGHGDTSVDSHLGLPVVEHDLTRLRKLELVPFKQAIQEGADVVMIAHLLMPKLDPEHPASFSKAVIDNLLRQELGYEGTIISDDMTMGAIVEHYDIADAAVQFIQAGGNIVLVGHDYEKEKQVIQALRDAVNSGKISVETLDERVYNVLKLKEKYALTNDSAPGPDTEQLNRDISNTLKPYGL